MIYHDEVLYYSQGSFFNGRVELHVVKVDGKFKAILSKQPDNRILNSTMLSSNEMDNLRTSLHDAGIDEWFTTYMDPYILDGTQWEFSFESIHSEGSNRYPSNFQNVLMALCDNLGFSELDASKNNIAPFIESVGKDDLYHLYNHLHDLDNITLNWDEDDRNDLIKDDMFGSSDCVQEIFCSLMQDVTCYAGSHPTVYAYTKKFSHNQEILSLDTLNNFDISLQNVDLLVAFMLTILQRVKENNNIPELLSLLSNGMLKQILSYIQELDSK